MCPLPNLYPSSSLQPATTDGSARGAGRAVCADTRAPAASRGETPALILVRPGAARRPNPESRPQQSADYSGARIPRTTRHTLSSNTLRSPGRPSALCQSFRPTYNLPESPCGPCPRAPLSASSTASRLRCNSKSPAATLRDEMPPSAACPGAQLFLRQCAAPPTRRRWQKWKPVPPTEAVKCQFPVPWKSPQSKPLTSGSLTWSSRAFHPAARFPSAARIQTHECICRSGLRPIAAQS